MAVHVNEPGGGDFALGLDHILSPHIPQDPHPGDQISLDPDITLEGRIPQSVNYERIPNKPIDHAEALSDTLLSTAHTEISYHTQQL